MEDLPSSLTLSSNPAPAGGDQLLKAPTTMRDKENGGGGGAFGQSFASNNAKLVQSENGETNKKSRDMVKESSALQVFSSFTSLSATNAAPMMNSNGLYEHSQPNSRILSTIEPVSSVNPSSREVGVVPIAQAKKENGDDGLLVVDSPSAASSCSSINSQDLNDCSMLLLRKDYSSNSNILSTSFPNALPVDEYLGCLSATILGPQEQQGGGKVNSRDAALLQSFEFSLDGSDDDIEGCKHNSNKPPPPNDDSSSLTLLQGLEDEVKADMLLLASKQRDGSDDDADSLVLSGSENGDNNSHGMEESLDHHGLADMLTAAQHEFDEMMMNSSSLASTAENRLSGSCQDTATHIGSDNGVDVVSLTKQVASLHQELEREIQAKQQALAVAQQATTEAERLLLVMDTLQATHATELNQALARAATVQQEHDEMYDELLLTLEDVEELKEEIEIKEHQVQYVQQLIDLAQAATVQASVERDQAVARQVHLEQSLATLQDEQKKGMEQHAAEVMMLQTQLSSLCQGEKMIQLKHGDDKNIEMHIDKATDSVLASTDKAKQQGHEVPSTGRSIHLEKHDMAVSQHETKEAPNHAGLPQVKIAPSVQVDVSSPSAPLQKGVNIQSPNSAFSKINRAHQPLYIDNPTVLSAQRINFMDRNGLSIVTNECSQSLDAPVSLSGTEASIQSPNSAFVRINQSAKSSLPTAAIDQTPQRAEPKLCGVQASTSVSGTGCPEKKPRPSFFTTVPSTRKTSLIHQRESRISGLTPSSGTLSSRLAGGTTSFRSVEMEKPIQPALSTGTRKLGSIPGPKSSAVKPSSIATGRVQAASKAKGIPAPKARSRLQNYGANNQKLPRSNIPSRVSRLSSMAKPTVANRPGGKSTCGATAESLNGAPSILVPKKTRSTDVDPESPGRGQKSIGGVCCTPLTASTATNHETPSVLLSTERDNKFSLICNEWSTAKKQSDRNDSSPMAQQTPTTFSSSLTCKRMRSRLFCTTQNKKPKIQSPEKSHASLTNSVPETPCINSTSPLRCIFTFMPDISSPEELLVSPDMRALTIAKPSSLSLHNQCRELASIRVQRALRSFLARKRYAKALSRNIKIQALTRGYLQRKAYDRQVRGARHIQVFFRRARQRKIEHACVRLQAKLRSFLSRKRYVKRLSKNIKIQALVRGYLQRKASSKVVASACRIQRTYRSHRITRQVKGARTIQAFARRARQRKIELAASVRLQAKFRSFLVQGRYTTTISKLIRFQALVRGYLLRSTSSTLGHQMKGARTLQQQTERLQQYNSAACVRIQAKWRGNRARSLHVKQQSSAVLIQKIVRASMARSKLQNIRNACICKFIQWYLSKPVTVIQATWRCISTRQKYCRDRSSVVLVQSLARGKRDRRQHAFLMLAATKIQTTCRGWKAKNHYQRVQAAVALLQSCARSYQCRAHLMKDTNAKHCAALTIQTYWRPRKAIYQRRVALLEKNHRSVQAQIRHERAVAAMTIQCSWRRRQTANNVAKTLQRHQSSTRMQSLWRGYQTRHGLSEKNEASKKIQAVIRSATTRGRLLRMRVSSVKVQTVWRSKFQLNKYKLVVASVVKIQSVARSRLTRLALAKASECEMQAASITIQRCWRGSIAMKDLSLLQSRIAAAVTVQSAWRRRQATNQVSNVMRLNHSSKLIQSFWRGYHARSELTEKTDASTRIQAMFRFVKMRRAFLQERQSIIVVQTFMRSHVQRGKYKWVLASAIKIQAVTRGRLTRMGLAMDSETNYATQAASITIQRYWRGASAFQSFNLSQARVLRVQSAIRRVLAINRAKKMRHAALSLQRFGRSWLAHRRQLSVDKALTEAAILLQSSYRGHVLRRELVYSRTSASSIQRIFRGQCARIRTKAMKRDIIVIQSIVRVWLSHRVSKRRSRSIVYIQSKARRYLALKHAAALKQLHQREQLAAVKIQCFVRLMDAKNKTTALFMAKIEMSANKIQRIVRGHLGRLRVKSTTRAVVIVQSAVRVWLSHRAVQRRSKSIVCIQSTVRLFLAVQDATVLKKLKRETIAAVQLQCLFRSMVATNKKSALVLAKKELIATKIQRIIRGYVARLQVKSMMWDIVIVQAIVRAWYAHRLVQRRSNSIVCIQSTTRRLLAVQRATVLKQLKREIIATVQLQCFVRCITAKGQKDALFAAKLKQVLAAIKIQRVARGRLARLGVKATTRGVMLLQSIARVWLSRGAALRRRGSIASIQSAARCYLAGKQVAAMQQRRRETLATIKIQCLIRRMSALSKKESLLLAKKKAASTVQLQSVVRGFLGRRTVATILNEKRQQQTSSQSVTEIDGTPQKILASTPANTRTVTRQSRNPIVDVANTPQVRPSRTNTRSVAQPSRNLLGDVASTRGRSRRAVFQAPPLVNHHEEDARQPPNNENASTENNRLPSLEDIEGMKVDQLKNELSNLGIEKKTFNRLRKADLKTLLLETLGLNEE